MLKIINKYKIQVRIYSYSGIIGGNLFTYFFLNENIKKEEEFRYWFLNNFTFFMMILDMFAYYAATFTNVFEIEQDLPYLKEVVGQPKVYCKKCESFKPERTHHCSVCEKCVQKMDHHCPWIVNCVGQRNHKSFFLFMVYSMVSCL